MPRFTAPDGTVLAYDVRGDADAGAAPFVCIAGGAMREPAYLGDLGGLAARRPLVVLHLRGTGDSERPADPAGYRCDRQVPDLEALRGHLGLDRLDLLAHSAGASIALHYATAHPSRVASLTLITPSLRALGLPTTDEHRIEAQRLREKEPWFDGAFAAAERIRADADAASDADWLLYARFFYGRWDEQIERFELSGAQQLHLDLGAQYIAPGAFDPPRTKAALAALTAPVLILTAEYDAIPLPRVGAVAAGSFPNARLAVQPGAGHYPWIDDPAEFIRLVTES